jgi:hypothetical protein
LVIKQEIRKILLTNILLREEMANNCRLIVKMLLRRAIEINEKGVV